MGREAYSDGGELPYLPQYVDQLEAYLRRFELDIHSLPVYVDGLGIELDELHDYTPYVAGLRRYIDSLIPDAPGVSAHILTPIVNLLTRIRLYRLANSLSAESEGGTSINLFTALVALETDTYSNPFKDIKTLPFYEDEARNHLGRCARKGEAKLVGKSDEELLEMALVYLSDRSDEGVVLLANSLIQSFNQQLDRITDDENGMQLIEELQRRVRLLVHGDERILVPIEFHSLSGLCGDAATPLICQTGLIRIIVNEPDAFEEYRKYLDKIPKYKDYLYQYLQTHHKGANFDYDYLLKEHTNQEAVDQYDAVVDEYNAFIQPYLAEGKTIMEQQALYFVMTLLNRMQSIRKGEPEFMADDAE